MAITINTVPANISNAALFNVTTSVAETPGTYNNVRIRADVTISAVIVAVVEKPRGLPDFDFGDILKSMVPGLTFARDSGSIVIIAASGTGAPLVAYTVKFTEVWENASGVTTTGAYDTSATKRYVPAKGDQYTFSKYVLALGIGGLAPATRLANKTLLNTVVKYYTLDQPEYWITFFTEVVHCQLRYSKDGGTYTNLDFDPVNGWGVIVVNIGELMAGVTDNLRLRMHEQTGGEPISEIFIIYPDSSCNDERCMLEYDGLVGGKEYLAFEGLKDIDFSTLRTYYSGAKKNRKLLTAYGLIRQKLETLFKDQPNTEYLKSLLISENVKKLDPSYVTTDVTIISDTVRINQGRELFTNQIEIEYEY